MVEQPNVPSQPGFGVFGPPVRAPMPAGSWNDLPNNPAPSSASATAPAADGESQLGSPARRAKSVRVEITPEEKENLVQIQRISFRSQYFGLTVGAAAGYYLARRKMPTATLWRCAPAMMAGAFFSPFWSIPLAYFLSKPYIRKIEHDDHFKAVVAQAQNPRTPTSVNNIPVRPTSEEFSDSSTLPAEAASSRGLGGFGTSSTEPDGSTSPSSDDAGSSAEPVDAWARLRRQNAPSPGHSAWDTLRKNQGASSSPGHSEASSYDTENVWGDTPANMVRSDSLSDARQTSTLTTCLVFIF